MKPRLLDLCCKAGGCSIGYDKAGFEVVGVDREPQLHYPFEFHQADALTFPLEGFDAYHASPPCQDSSMAAIQWRKKGKEYPQIIAEIRERFIDTGKPYVIENVLGSPLINPIKLNGAMFSLRIRRTRLFECNFDIPFFLIPKEARSNFRMGRPPRGDEWITPVGHFSGVGKVKEMLGFTHMNQAEIAEAIPWQYTEYIGKYLMEHIQILRDNHLTKFNK